MSSEERRGVTKAHAFEGLIGYSVNNDYAPLPPLQELTLPQRTYLSFHYTGDNAIASLSDLYRHVFSTGLLSRREILVEDSFFHYYPSGQVPGRCTHNSIRIFLPVEG
jgi:predicted transcriptional regulator YdeE